MMKYILVIGATQEISGQLRFYLEDATTEIVFSLSADDAIYQLSMRKFVLIIMEASYAGAGSHELFLTMQNQIPAPIMIIYTNAKIPNSRRNMGLTREETSDSEFDMSGWAFKVKNYLEEHTSAVGKMRSYILARGHDLVIDATTRKVSLHGEPLELSQKQFDILHFLARHPGQVLSKDQIFNHLKIVPEVDTDNSITLQISKLRKKLGDAPGAPTYIQTVRGIGYRFAE